VYLKKYIDMIVRKEGEKEPMSWEAKEELKKLLLTLLVGLVFFGIIFLVGFFLNYIDICH